MVLGGECKFRFYSPFGLWIRLIDCREWEQEDKEMKDAWETQELEDGLEA